MVDTPYTTILYHKAQVPIRLSANPYEVALRPASIEQEGQQMQHVK